MTDKRFDYSNYDDGTESIYDRKKDEYYWDMQLSQIEELLNELNDENEQLKAVMKELRDMLQSDVDNGIKTYPKTLLEYLISALEKIGDFE